MITVLAALLLQAAPAAQAAPTPAPELDNAWVRVHRNAAPCASAATAGCHERVLVALGDTEVRAGGQTLGLVRGDVVVFAAGQSHEAPRGGPYFEVAFKEDAPPVQEPAELILPEKNQIRYDGARFFVFEEHLAVGDTRARHSHSQRVVIQLNRTKLQQWPDGQPELLRDIAPDRVGFNAPVIHVVKNVGELPLRGIVIELKGERQRRGPGGTPEGR